MRGGWSRAGYLSCKINAVHFFAGALDGTGSAALAFDEQSRFALSKNLLGLQAGLEEKTGCKRG